jgi:malic enzyme
MNIYYFKGSKEILTNAVLNKGTAFSQRERAMLGLRGLLPYTEEPLEVQKARVMWQMKRLKEPINKYIYLSSLCERNHTLFYYVMQENLEELMPIVYTPTVGEACQNFQNIWRQTEGLYICEKFKGNIRHVLDDWPMTNVDIIVLTDGSRILGLGDLGVNGMGIPIGKLHLYVAAAGFNPARVLPVVIDVGTNNEHLLESPFYMGLRKRRTEGEAFYSLVDELMDGIQDKWPNALVQFEDFQNEKAFGILECYCHKYLCFNDDI